MNYSKLVLIFAVLLALSPMTSFGNDRHSTGAVYAMTNGPAGNQIAAFERDVFGRLKLNNFYDTGGLGSGGGIDPLASQDSLILSSNNRWLFAVNAGSDDISVFRRGRHALKLVDTYYSGGVFPVSLAFYHNLLYVLNAGDDATAPNVTGFKINHHGKLLPLAGSTRSLPGDGFHQVGFSPKGDNLIVTKGGADADEILIFAIDEEGQPDAAPTISQSAGSVPFGFIFDRRGHLLVAEAGSGAVTSYAILDDNTLEIIDASVANGNLATCWIAGTWFGAVFTANTASDNISNYSVRAYNGALHLREAAAGAGNKPIDIAVTNSGKYLYILNAAEGTVGSFRITPNGGLKDLGTVEGLPLDYAQGIVAR